MADRPRPVWDHTDCRGTVGCPPRCPRFVDAEGGPLVVRPVEDPGRVWPLYAAVADADRSMGVPPAGERQRRAWLDRLFDRGRNLAAVDGDRPVGHVAYAPADDPEPHLVVFVERDRRGRGLGTELCRHAIAHAAAADRSALVLDVDRDNERAIAVYRRLGFEVVDRTPMEYRMRLSTTAPVADEVRRPPARW